MLLIDYVTNGAKYILSSLKTNKLISVLLSKEKRDIHV